MKCIFFLLLFTLMTVFYSCSSDDNIKYSQMQIGVDITEMDYMVHELMEKRINTVTREVTKKEIFEICNKYQIKPLPIWRGGVDLSNKDSIDFLCDKTLDELINSLTKEKQELLMILSTYALDRPMYASYEEYRENLAKKIVNKNDLALGLIIVDFIEQNKDVLDEFHNSILRYSVQSRASLGLCDYCAAGASVIIGDMAVTCGVAGAVAGPLGVSVGIAGGIVGALGGLAYYSAFC